MTFPLPRLGAAIVGCAAACVFSTGVAAADPPDPHQPDMTKGFCPGGRWGYGNLAVCDGEKYPDGSFWHQWMKTWIVGPQFYYDCVGGDPGGKHTRRGTTHDRGAEAGKWKRHSDSLNR
ncbi:hypothetical protein MTAB308_5131 [Mycobacterium terramassiliense]|uniref:Secreted protein n=1 Tax=Mycobacterium terramassiliense TaxID=1841859 RepID=A0A2U3NJ99_9MYCO|nr:hypothetical protein [Mycobacterium terramassiliense]SPM31611.1 hypothetical protein MTAB308_5131 [Mycobacterium terramassiliense]